MLRKLIKHEFKANWKTFGLIYAALLILTLVTRGIYELDFESEIFKLTKYICTFAYVLMVVFVAFFNIIIAVVRFYRNMLKDQGYLMNTIPVKTRHNIAAKTLTFTIWGIASFAAALFSIFIFFVGNDKYSLIMKQIGNTISDVFKYPSLGAGFILFIGIVIIQYAANLLGIYAALSIGQIFNKHKILAAVICYYALNNIISGIFMFLGILIQPLIDKLDNVQIQATSINNSTRFVSEINANFGPILGILIFSFIANIVLLIIYYLISNYFLSKKLNLE